MEKSMPVIFEYTFGHFNILFCQELRSLLELLLESAILFCFLLPLTYLPELSLPV
jgi:hypothetical protein